MGAKVGDKISGVLQIGPWIDGMPTPVDMAERCKGKKVFLIGLPGEVFLRDRQLRVFLSFHFRGGRVSWELFDLNRLRTFPSSSSRMCICAHQNLLFPLLPQLFSSFKFKVLLLHDPRVKFRVSLPGKTIEGRWDR